MQVFRLAGVALTAALLVAGTGSGAAAALREPDAVRAADRQDRATQGVTPADIQRLRDGVYQAGGELSQLRESNPELAERLQQRLDDISDETIYLKVKLRKEGNVERTEYWELRDRLDNLRSEIRRALTPNVPPPPPEPVRPPVRQIEAPPPVPEVPKQSISSNPYEVPVGTEIDVRLQNALSSATAQVEDRFQATTMVDLVRADRVLIPAGSIVRGVVTSVDKAGRIDRKGSLTLSFDQVTVQGRSYPIHATVTQAIESEGVRGEAGKIGAGGAVGGIIGGILGGFKGALAGVLIGAGGTVAATPGKDVELQPGTVLRLRFDAPLVVR